MRIPGAGGDIPAAKRSHGQPWRPRLLNRLECRERKCLTQRSAVRVRRIEPATGRPGTFGPGGPERLPGLRGGWKEFAPLFFRSAHGRHGAQAVGCILSDVSRKTIPLKCLRGTK